MGDTLPGLFDDEPTPELTEIGVFDYRLLSAEKREFVLQKTDETQMLLKRTAEKIIEIGKNLNTVKELLPHGMFSPWLQSEFEMSRQTANRFMQVAERFEDKLLTVSSLSSSALYLLASPSTPQEAVDEALYRANSGEKITQALAKQIIDAQEAIKKSQDAEAKARADLLVAQQRLFDTEADLQDQIATLNEQIKTMETPPVREVEKQVVPPEVQKKLVDLQKEQDRLQAERKSQDERIEKLKADVEVSIRKREFAENADRIRQGWRQITSETHSCLMRLLGQWPTPIDVQAFEADDWAQVDHLKSTLKRVLSECDALHYGSSGVIEDTIIESGLVPYVLNGNR